MIVNMKNLRTIVLDDGRKIQYEYAAGYLFWRDTDPKSKFPFKGLILASDALKKEVETTLEKQKACSNSK